MRRAYAVIAMLVSMPFSLMARDALAAQERYEWVIAQKSPLYGKRLFYISHDAVKIVDASGSEFELLAKAPSWKEYCFKRSTRVYAVTDHFELQDALVSAAYVKTGLPGEPGSFKSIGKVRSSGLTCTKYLEPVNNYTLTADDITVDPKVAEILSTYYSIPNFKSVPIANWTGTASGEETKLKTGSPRGAHQDSAIWISASHYYVPVANNYKFKTESCRKVPYNASDFELPNGLRKVKELSQIVIDTDQRKKIQSMIEDVGFASDLGKGPDKQGKKKQPPVRK